MKTILDRTRNPQLAHQDEDHTYDDKYTLAEMLVNTSIAAKLNILEQLGLSRDKLQRALAWVYHEKQSVTLRLEAEDTCSFLKENIISVETNEACEVATTSSFLGIGNTQTETLGIQVFKQLKENHWKVGTKHRFLIYKGNNPDNGIELQSRNISTVIVNRAVTHEHCKPTGPIAERTSHPPIEINLTWMLQQIAPNERLCQFYIDRTKSSCRTPRRNENVDEAIQFEHDLQTWARAVASYPLKVLQLRIGHRHKPTSPTEDGTDKCPDLGSITDENIFAPVVPLLEHGSVLSTGDVAAFLDEHNRSLQASIADTRKSFPNSQLMQLISNQEATTYLLCQHISTLVKQTVEGLDYVENMLHQQLVQAIGKEVGEKHFEEYIRHHHHKLFVDTFAPVPFTYAIRRPDHCPDGMLSIEAVDKQLDPVYTWVRKLPDTGRPSTFVPIDAATSVELRGGCYLHGWLQHRFKSLLVAPSFQLAARARQLSSFLLIVGNMMGPNQLSPKAAIILQNKDELQIPLITDVLPSAKDFKDAISSLSPEQQDFAKSFRSMQLESSVFGVCVIQIKPQLERLLGLPDDALTKEIQLTQDLMSLFIDYQIPSDLLSLQHVSSTPATDAEKVALVKGYVKSVTDMIASETNKQLDEQTGKADMRTEIMHKKTGGRGLSMVDNLTKLGLYKSQTSSHYAEGEIYNRADGKKVRRVKKTVVTQKSSQLATLWRGVSEPPSALSSQSGAGESGMSDIFRDGDDQQTLPEADHETPRVSPSNEDMGEINSTDVLKILDQADKHAVVNDLTTIPTILDEKLEALDTDNSLHSTIIKAGEKWTRNRQQNLLVSPESSILTSKDIQSEKNKAFDLLDAISRSGTLPIDCSEFHIVIAISHCFENDVM